jgi:hypothetical protein
MGGSRKERRARLAISDRFGLSKLSARVVCERDNCQTWIGFDVQKSERENTYLDSSCMRTLVQVQLDGSL